MVSSVRNGSGLVAWWLRMKRFVYRTKATKRALRKPISNTQGAKRVKDIQNILFKLEEIFSKYQTMAQNPLHEHIETVIMVELCTPELREHLQLNGKDID